jgi:NAD(P)H-flavin reductase/hemoglobin-like flavoprotein
MDTVRLTASFAAVSARGPRAIRYFFAHLFLTDPQLRDLLPISLAEPVEQFGAAAATVVECLGHPETLRPLLARMADGQRHLGIRPEHYRAGVGSALATLERFSGPDWDDALAAAWTVRLSEIADLLASARSTAGELPVTSTATVDSHERRGPQVAVLRVRPEHRLSYQPGQHLLVETRRWPRLWRPYSIGNAPRPDGTIDLHVRQIDGGPVSSALTLMTKAGDEIRLGPASGSLTLNQASARSVLLVAGSTGLAPLKAILEQLIHQESTRAVHLFFGACRYADLYELFALRQMANELPWLTVVPVTSKEQHPECEFGLLPDVLPRYGRWTEHDSYVCGPTAMVVATRSQLQRLGVPVERVRFEGGSPDLASQLRKDDHMAVAPSVVRSVGASVVPERRAYEVD